MLSAADPTDPMWLSRKRGSEAAALVHRPDKLTGLSLSVGASPQGPVSVSPGKTIVERSLPR